MEIQRIKFLIHGSYLTHSKYLIKISIVRLKIKDRFTARIKKKDQIQLTEY